LGNTILSDDGVGIVVARALRGRLDAEVVEACLSGLSLLDIVAGRERLIVVDSIKTGRVPPGTLRIMGLDDLGAALHLSHPHALNLPTVLALAEAAGDDIPRDIRIYGIEVEDNTTFSERLTPGVGAAVEGIVRRIAELEGRPARAGQEGGNACLRE